MRVRLYLVDENQPVLMDDYELKHGGFVTGRVENGVYLSVPQWRVHHVEEIPGE